MLYHIHWTSAVFLTAFCMHFACILPSFCNHFAITFWSSKHCKCIHTFVFPQGGKEERKGGRSAGTPSFPLFPFPSVFVLLRSTGGSTFSSQKEPPFSDSPCLRIFHTPMNADFTHPPVFTVYPMLYFD